MTAGSPRPSTRRTGLALVACAVLATTALAALIGHGITASAALPRPTAIDGAIPGPTTVTVTRSDAPESSLAPRGVSEYPTTLYRTATVTRWRSSSAVTAAPRTVTAARTATATVTADHTATATATQTVTATATVTITAAPPAPTAGSTQ